MAEPEQQRQGGPQEQGKGQEQGQHPYQYLPQGPGQPHPQQGYWQWHPYPQQGAAGRKSGPTLLIVCLVLVSVLAGGGAWLVFGGGSSSEAGGSGGLRVAWSQAGPASLPRTDEMDGVWVAGGTVAVATDSAITAYALSDGRARWTWRPPAGDIVCSVSPTVSGGIGAVASGPDGASCKYLQAVNVATGKSVWAHPASLSAQSGDTGTEWPLPFVSGGLAFAVDTDFVLDAFDLGSGARRWSSAAVRQSTDDSCMVDDATVIGYDVYAAMNCLDGAFLYGLDPGSGQVTTHIALPTACADALARKFTWAVGQDAIVNCTDREATDNTLRFLIVEPSSGRVTPVTLPSVNVKLDPFVAGSSQASPHGFAVSGDTLYVQTLTGDNSQGTDEVLNALSLSTGATQWSQPLARNFEVAGADADGCVGLAYGMTSADAGDNLDAVRYGAQSGARSTLGTIADENQDYAALARQPFTQVGTQVVMLGPGVSDGEMFVSVLDGV